MSKNVISLLFSILLQSMITFSQDSELNLPENKSNFKDKLVFGGNIGANFGTVTFIEFSPVVGYKIKPKLIGGIGINLNYFSDRFQTGLIYGPSTFVRYQALEELFLHCEYQQSFTSFEIKGSGEVFKSDFPMFLVGGGYYARLGGNSRIGATVLFDLIEDRNSFYQNPIIRGGVLFGI